MPKKIVPINYTARDFNSIKESLVEYIRRYYPETFRDFSEASFGSLMLDTVAYIGDVLSFYLDYQANESFLDTAVEYNNIIRIGKQLGYKFKGNPSSYGLATFYILIPAVDTGLAPDMAYMPVLKRKSTFKTSFGATFMLDEDVHFDNPNNEIRVARVNESTGVPTAYAVKGHGRVVSGRIANEIIQVNSYQKFLKLELDALNVAEIISVIDDEGHDYYEVDYLSQDVIYRAITNRNDHRHDAANILKPFMVPRRFVVDRERFRTQLQFGGGSDIEYDADNVVRPSMVDPANVVLRRHGAPNITDHSFDPYKLIESDEYGIAPANTMLSVTMRINTADDVNVRTGILSEVGQAFFEFKDEKLLLPSDVSAVKASLEITNEKPIVGDVSLPDGQELKRRISDVFATQNRAVTSRDYESMTYSMPPELGAVKRCKVHRDHDSLKRNLNLYVVSENANQNLVETNDTIKENLKTWLMKNKMVNDTIDILDAKVINVAVDWEAVGRLDMPKFDILTTATTALKKHFVRQPDIGEPFWITDIYKVLKSVDGIVDVSNVNITLKSGGDYADIRFNIRENTSSDGRYIEVPKNCIVEIKHLKDDIKGVIK